MIELSQELAAVEGRYAELLQELAGLYQVREQLRRALSTPSEAPRKAASTRRRVATLGNAAQEPTTVKGRARGRDVATLSTLDTEPSLTGADGTKPVLRVLRGAGDDTSPAVRLAQKQGTRAQLRLVDGGRAAS